MKTNSIDIKLRTIQKSTVSRKQAKLKNLILAGGMVGEDRLFTNGSSPSVLVLAATRPTAPVVPVYIESVDKGVLIRTAPCVFSGPNDSAVKALLGRINVLAAKTMVVPDERAFHVLSATDAPTPDAVTSLLFNVVGVANDIAEYLAYFQQSASLREDMKLATLSFLQYTEDPAAGVESAVDKVSIAIAAPKE